MLDEDRKQDLANRFLYFPLVRLLLFTRWFRIMFVILVLLALVLGLLFPRLWRVSPDGYHPPVKVSLLNLIQVWNDRRTAEAQMAEGRAQDSLQTWRNALVLNPANAGLVRGLLRAVTAVPEPAAYTVLVNEQAKALLRITQTNQTDLELVAQVFEKCRLTYALVNLLSPLENLLPPSLDPAYLKALFRNQELARFHQRWETVQGRLPEDAALALYREAYLAGWGPADGRPEARQKLEAAAAEGPHRDLANHLLLQVCRQQRDFATAQRALNALVDAQADELRDHVTFWRLLAAEGRNLEAAQLLQACQLRPASPLDAADLVDLCFSLALQRQAQQQMEWALNTFGYDPLLCARYATLLIETRDWNELRTRAVQIRLQPGVTSSKSALSYFMEARADLGEGQVDFAQVALDKLSGFELDDPLLTLTVVNGLIDVGFPDPAVAILSRVEPKLATRRDYWQALTRAAFLRGNTVTLLRAVRRLYQSDPNDLAAAADYALAVIIQRAEPDQALQLTTNLLSRLPDNLMVQVRYGAALALNRQAQQAQKVLGQVNPSLLSPPEATQYHLALLEALLDLGQTNQASAISARIETNYLYAPQFQWLRSVATNLPPPLASASGGR